MRFGVTIAILILVVSVSADQGKTNNAGTNPQCIAPGFLDRTST
jgi:hypothetical protein